MYLVVLLLLFGALIDSLKAENHFLNLIYQFCCPFELCHLEKQHRSSVHTQLRPLLFIFSFHYFIIFYVFRHIFAFRENIYIFIALGMIKIFFYFYFILKVFQGYNFMSTVEIQNYLRNDIQTHASTPLSHYDGSGFSN